MSRSQPRAGRWPDLLIGLLVLLLLAGFAALLLGQNRPEVAQAPAASVTDTPPVIPSAPGSDLGATDAPPPAVPPAPTADPDTATPPTTAQAPEEQIPAEAAPPTSAAPPAAVDEAAAPTAPGAAEQTTPPPAGAVTAPETVVPADPIPAAPVTPPVASVTLPTPTTTIPLDSAPAPVAGGAAQADGAAPPRAGGAVATSEQRTPLRSDYRISLGTFSSESAARSAAQGVQGLGYTVYPIDLGEQVVAQVGPFADEGSARQALADIQRAYPGAIVYPPRGRTLTGGSQSGGAGTAPSPSQAPPTVTPAETAQPEAVPPPAPADTAPPTASPPAPAAPGGPVYLQVGAFDRVESAQTLVGQLREQGYAPTVNAPEGRKVTVLIGPFSGEALGAAEAKLDANGFDHFRVR